MPIIKKINYLDAILSRDDDEFLLAVYTFNWRYRGYATLGQNVGSTLFYYKGERFGPFAAHSEHRGSGSTIGHSERRSFAEAIRQAIEARWGPFKDLGLKAGDIPDSLSIDDITTNKQLKPLLNPLQKLDAVKIFSERAFCDYSWKQQEDTGCLPYFKNLAEIIGDKIHVFHALPIQKEPDSQEALDAACRILNGQRDLIAKKQEIIKTKKLLMEQHKEEDAKLKIDGDSLTSETISASTNVTKKVKFGAEEGLNISVTMKESIAAKRKIAIKLGQLREQKKEINEELRKAFGLPASFAQLPAEVVLSSDEKEQKLDKEILQAYQDQLNLSDQEMQNGDVLQAISEYVATINRKNIGDKEHAAAWEELINKVHKPSAATITSVSNRMSEVSKAFAASRDGGADMQLSARQLDDKTGHGMHTQQSQMQEQQPKLQAEAWA